MIKRFFSPGRRLAVVLGACLLMSAFASAQGSAGIAKHLADYDLPGLEAKVNLTSIEPMDVVQLIEFLAHRGGLNNIVIGRDVQGVTTKLKFDDVTVADALDVVLSVNRLSFEIQGGILTIMTDEEYKLRHGRSFYDQTDTKVVTLIYADPARVAAMLAPVKSSFGTIISDPVTGSLVLVDTPRKIRKMEEIISKTDISTVGRILPTKTETFVLQYAEIDTIRAELEGLLTPEIGKIRSDERTKTLIVTDLPHSMERVRELVSVFDRKPKQVFIEAKIVQVRLDDSMSLGVNWQNVFEGIDPRFSVETVSSPSSISDPAFSLTYNTISAGGDLAVVIEALKTVGETKILSNPQIAVLDGQEARIEVVDDQPYKEIQLESGTTNITGTTYLFKKVGVQLAVTPRINDEDVISVMVRPEISTISAWYDGSPQEGTPVIRQAVTETTIMVHDSVTIIIGGLISSTKSESVTSVPFLGAIPLFGRLFRQDSISTINSESIVFLTPRIITGDEPYLRLNEEKKAPKLLKTEG
ncbi:MAG: hypothetical protein ISS35_09840 [Kiritimatiellae bacterium]|nr:hypothetical protein [Kiritimatiellia bacterium]